MPEGFPLPEKRGVSAQQKLETLMRTLEDLSGPAHADIDPALTEKAIERTKERIAALRRENPGLNN